MDPRTASLALLITLLSTLLVAPFAIHVALGWGFPARLAMSTLLSFPAGFLMGVPFVAGLGRVGREAPGFIAWAWAINGSTSSVSGVVAAMIGLTWGLRATMAVGLLAYVIAALAGTQVFAPSEGKR
jgi:hypothetical protein